MDHRRVRLGAVALAASVICGGALAPAVGAAPAPGKDACKNGSWQSLGYKNQGQCVSDANAAARAGEAFPRGGGGGGGET